VDKEEAIPFNEDMTKQQMIDHLMDTHQYYSAGGRALRKDAKKSGATKADMIRTHDALHATLDSDERHDMGDGYFSLAGRRGRVPAPTVDHVHQDLALAPHVASAMDDIRSGGALVTGGKLSAGERSALTRLINNDYAALKADLQSLAAQALENDIKQLELDWEDRRVKSKRWLAEVDARNRKFLKQRANLAKRASEDGIEIEYTHRSGDYLRATAKTAGYDKAVAETKERNKRLLNSALLKLERERLRAERSVLLSGVTEEAAKILDTIPSAETMLSEAMAREATARQLTTSTDAPVF